MKLRIIACIGLVLLACSEKETSVPAGGPTPGDAGASSTSSSGSAGSSSSSSSSSGTTRNPDDQADPRIVARPYETTVPSTYDETKPTPMVMVLHGYLSNGKDQDRYFGVSKLAEKEGFLVAAPNGTTSKSGNRFWAATDACCNLEGDDVDDVAYLTAVIADMKRRFNVDAKRVFLAGHSNGGFMAHRMACERPGDIAAIMSLAGAQFVDPKNCKAGEPVAVLQVHGDQDGTVAYEGGSFAPGLTYPAAKDTVAIWAEKNGCDAALAPTGETLDLEADLEGNETTISRHICKSGAAELWTIQNGKHIPAFNGTWAASFWKFFQAHPKP